MSRLKGHALSSEGAAYWRKGDGRIVREGWFGSTGGLGSALCECGAMSEVLGSANQRKAWHRAHKAEVSA